jgi:hypothetical protein
MCGCNREPFPTVFVLKKNVWMHTGKNEIYGSKKAFAEQNTTKLGTKNAYFGIFLSSSSRHCLSRLPSRHPVD